MECKRIQQLPTLLRQQRWELLRSCWQWSANGCNNSQHWCAYNVGSYCVRVLEEECKRMQQLSTMLGPAVHRQKDTTHKTLETMRTKRAWPQQCWKSCKRIQHCRSTLQRSRNKINVESCRLKSLPAFKLCPTTRYNIQQHATECADGRSM